MSKFKLNNPALSIVLSYLLTGCVYILFSDQLLELVVLPGLYTKISIFKGLLFVCLTATLLYVLISRYFNQLEKMRQSHAASEERLQMALTASHMGVWEWDLRTDQVVWSPEVYGIVGLKEFDGRFESFGRLLHPEDAGRVTETAQKALSDRDEYADEFRIIRPDNGEVRWLANLGQGRYGQDGTPLSMLGTVRDITAQKTTLAALRASEERMKLLLQSVKVGIWDWDLKSGLAYLSPEYLEIAEYHAENIVPDLDFFKSLVHPDDWENVIGSMNSHLKGETSESNVDFRIITGNGAVKWIASRGKVAGRDQNGVPLRMLGTMIDTSDRKTAEEYFRKFYTIIPDMICVASDTGYFMKLNPAWQATLGYSDQELKAVPYIEFVHPDDREMTLNMASSRASGIAVERFVNRYRSKDGSYRWLEWTTAPKEDDGLLLRIGP